MPARVLLTASIVPSSANETKPHGALSSSESMSNRSILRPNCSSGGEVILHHRDGLLRMAEVGAMPRRFQEAQRTVGNGARKIPAYFGGRDRIFGALHDQRRHG